MRTRQPGNQATSRRVRLDAPSLCCIVTLLTFILPPIAVAQSPPTPPSLALLHDREIVFKHALQTIAPSVVRIDTIGGAQPVRGEADIMQNQRVTAGFRQADGPTTGVIWSADGYILTSSFNFVRDPVVVTVTLADGRKFVAKLIARDYPARLALLKIDAADLPVPTWLDPAEIRPGQAALAVGWGFGGSNPALTAGIVSALRRKDARALQTDAKISPANYGGPLFDVEGRVLGVCVPMGMDEDEMAGVEWYDSGIGFAARRDFLTPRVARLMQGTDLRRGLLGINLDVREPVERESSESQPAGQQPGSQPSVRPPGLQVLGQSLGPAAQADLRENDYILAIDGVPTPSLLAFRRVMATKVPGDEIEVTYRRGDEDHVVRVRLASEEDFRPVPASQP